jgi:hypothetical protein
MERTPIRCILTFRVFGDTENIGALNFYADQPHAFDDESVETGMARLSLNSNTPVAEIAGQLANTKHLK